VPLGKYRVYSFFVATLQSLEILWFHKVQSVVMMCTQVSSTIGEDRKCDRHYLLWWVLCTLLFRPLATKWCRDIYGTIISRLPNGNIPTVQASDESSCRDWVRNKNDKAMFGW
jgi:hypothetical protein